MPTCLYCHAPMHGVEVLAYGVEALSVYLDIVVLYAHKTRQSERRVMDPTATWRMLCEAMQELEKDPHNRDLRTHAIDLLEVLARWLRMGGFPPVLQKNPA